MRLVALICLYVDRYSDDTEYLLLNLHLNCVFNAIMYVCHYTLLPYSGSTVLLYINCKIISSLPLFYNKTIQATVYTPFDTKIVID